MLWWALGLFGIIVAFAGIVAVAGIIYGLSLYIGGMSGNAKTYNEKAQDRSK